MLAPCSCLSHAPAPRLFWPENRRTAFRPFLDHGSGSRGIGLLEPVGSMSSKVLEVEPGSLEARSLSAPHPTTLWVPRVLCHRGLMENTYHACSFSAPPLARAHRGSPGRCCVSSRTTPAAPDREGSSARHGRRREVREAAGGGGGGGRGERQGSLHIPSQPGDVAPMSALRKPLWSPFLSSCPQQAAQTRETLGCSALLSLSRLLTISIPALPLGTELPPGHASVPKLMTTEPKACTSKSYGKTRS